MTDSVLMSSDLSDLCRVCLQMPEESQYLDLSTIYDEDDHLTYSDCFMICTQIDLKAGIGVPHHLCKPCGLELQMSYDFHKKIEESKRVIAKYEKHMQATASEQEFLPQNAVKIEQDKDPDEEQLNDDIQYPQSSKVVKETHCPQTQKVHKVTQNEQEYLLDSDDENSVELLSKIGSMKNDDNDEVAENEHAVSMDECIEIEEHLEMDDFQNLETLEEEESIANIESVVVKEEREQRDNNTESESIDNFSKPNIEEIQIENEVARYHITIINEQTEIGTEKAGIEKEIIEEYQKLEHGLKEPVKKTPIKCDICGHNLLNKNSLYQHRLRKHPESTAKAKRSLSKKDTPRKAKCNLCKKHQTVKETPTEILEKVKDNIATEEIQNDPIENEAIEKNYMEIKEIQEVKIEKEDDISVSETEVNLPIAENNIEIDEFKFENELIIIPDIQEYSLLSKITRIVCKICGESFLDKSSLRQHHLAEHSQEIMEALNKYETVTNKCNKLKTKNRNHNRKNHGIRNSSSLKNCPFICNVCNHAVATKNALVKHRLRKHSKKETIDYKNETQSRSGDIVNNASSSMSIEKSKVQLPVAKGPPYPCDMCDYKTATKVALYQHRYRAHRKNNEHTLKTRQFRCDQCYHSFLTQHSLDQHQILNHGKKTLSTSAVEPEAATSSTAQLAPPVSPSIAPSLISKAKPYVCDHCGYKLPTNMALIKHRYRKHRNDNSAFPFKCHLCVKGFRSMSYLRIHIESKHENEKLFICKLPECDEYFETLELLNQHALNHNEALYSCEFCDEMFPTLKSFQDHVHETHNIPVANVELNSIMVKEEMLMETTEMEASGTLSVEDDDEFN